MRKNYILDANILLHDPHSIFQFADNTVVIPIEVLGEIDRFKRERTDRGYNARHVARLLDGLREVGNLIAGVPVNEEGRLRVVCFETNGHAAVHVPTAEDPVDTRVLKVAQRVQQDEPDTPTVIVTKDINLRIRADAAGMRAEDYETDRVKLASLYTGQTEAAITPEQLAAFREQGELELPGKAFDTNQYVLLRDNEPKRGSALARATPDGLRLRALKHPDGALWGIRPRNKEQSFAIDALIDDDVPLVTLMGKAGTGKTLLAIAAAIHQTVKRKRFRGVLVCRPVVPVGRDLGFLPGDVGQKLDPWMKPVSDTVDYLLDSGGSVKGLRDCAALVRAGVIEIQPLTYIRGRSISSRFVVIDESQNLTPLEVKTIITRVGEGSKIVLTGDTQQIDNPYVDATSNGFTFLINRFRREGLAAHIELRKGERSQLAELAANLL